MTSISSTWSNFFAPSKLMTAFGTECATPSGAKDLIFAPAGDLLQWAKVLFNCPTDQHVESIGTLSSGLSIPGLFSQLGSLRGKCQLYKRGEGSSVRDIAQSSCLVANAGADVAQFGHAINVAPLAKESLKVVKSIFWGSLFLFDGMSFFEEISKAEGLQADLNSISEPGAKNILEHRIKLTYLNMLKSTTTVAMASIALVGILFASLAQGILFSPIVFLSLSSAWIVLKYITFFYEKMIDQWANPALSSANV